MTGKQKNCSTKTNRFKERRGKTGKMIGFDIKYQEAGRTQPRNSFNLELGKSRASRSRRKKGQLPKPSIKRLENMNKLPQQKTHDQKVARLKQARERLHRS